MLKLDEYASAVKAVERGDKAAASKHLALSLGVEHPTKEMQDSIDSLLDKNTPIHEAITRLVAKEALHG
jgi:hypothetical protein